MKKIPFLFFALLLLAACSKDPASSNDPIELDPTDVVLSSADFQGSSGHTTTGSVKLIKDKNGDKFLILENFDTDSGPDLRFYLSTSKTDDDFTEISKTITLGNVKLPVPSSANTDTQTYVLVWCKQFSVLFGYASF